MIKSHKFIFIHIPKAAGVSVIKSLFGNVLIVDHDIRNKNFKYLRDYPQTVSAEYIFTFTRNPWSRLASAYFYLARGGREPEDKQDFEQYLSKYSNFKDMIVNWDDMLFDQIHFKQQYKWICDNDEKLIPDFIGRFENLQEDFNAICDKIGIPQQQLPHSNKSDHKHYTEYYDDETRDIVAKKYAKDIEYFGYKYGD